MTLRKEYWDPTVMSDDVTGERMEQVFDKIGNEKLDDIDANTDSLESLASDIKANQTNNTQLVKLRTENGDVLSDDFTDAIVTIESEHRKIHQGNAYRTASYFPIGANEIKYFQFKTWAKSIHFKQITLIDWMSSFLCEMLESPTVTDWTVTMPIYNANRNSVNVSTVTIYSDPTGVSGGEVINIEYLPASNQSPTASGWNSIEYVLKSNASYVFRLTNLSNSAWNLLNKCFWYEI